MKSDFEFLHAADLHIDSPLRGLDRYEGAPVEEIRSASRRAFENLVAFAVKRQVEFVILAGDVFDGDWRDYNTGLWFSNQLRRLTDAGIRVYVLAGNHDAQGKMTRSLSYPAGVFSFGVDAPETFVDEPTGAVLHGQGFKQRVVDANLAVTYPAPEAGVLNIGVLHTALDGREGHAPYAPCTLQDLQARGYDYWALGHIHKREVVAEDPWVVFPGNLQGRHARETGPKGASLVTVAGGRVIEVAHRVLDVVRWERVGVDVSGCVDRQACVDAVAEALGAALDQAEGRPVVARVVVTGQTEAHADLRRAGETFADECRNAANARQDVWVEKIKVQTRPVHAHGAGEDLVRDLGLEDEGLMAEVREQLKKDLSKLKQHLADPDDYEALLDQVLVAARDQVVDGLLAADRNGGRS